MASAILKAGLRRHLEELRKANGTDESAVAEQAERSERFSHVMYKLHCEIAGDDSMTFEEYRADERERQRRWEQLTPEQQAARSKFTMDMIDWHNRRPYRLDPSSNCLVWLEDTRPRPVPPPGMEAFAEAFR